MDKSLAVDMGLGLRITTGIKEKIMRFPTQRRLEKMLETISGVQQLTVVLHNNPDPDAIASGAALKYLLERKVGLQAEVVYQGVIGRAENKALVDYLDVPLRQLPDENPQLPENLALVDTHTSAKNNPLSEGGTLPLIVIDHHNNHQDDQAVFSDIRPNVGATSTMMTEYLRAADCDPPHRLATALLYGIKTDTQALSRNTTTADVIAYCYLSTLADIDAYLSFDQAQVPAGYFRGLAAAMAGIKVYEGGLVTTYLPEMSYPDLVAEIADLLLRLEGCQLAICLGTFEKRLHFSIRSRSDGVDVEALAQVIAGEDGNAGGRDTIAGGQIPLNDDDPEKLVEAINQRILEFFNISPEANGELLS
ncbi:MAG: bifunctional oligoribonuclease/PAP phosphatase NrnA [Candidatus Promineifilaceae bacterium]